MTNNLYPVHNDTGAPLILKGLPTVGAPVASLADGTIITPGNMRANVYYNSSGGPARMMDTSGGNPIQFWVDNSGNFHVQNALNNSDICSWYRGTGKTFVIDHPTDPERLLVHVCLEGPEAAVFYRGECLLGNQGSASVALPDYFAALTVSGSESVQVTPVLEDDDDPFGPVAATRVQNGVFTIRGKPEQVVSWRVEATRADIADVQVEPLRSDVIVQGQGPYTWVQTP